MPQDRTVKILFVGDIVGKGGRRAVRELVPRLRAEYDCSFCIANGENMAGGGGMTRKCLEELRKAEVDVFTGGDHMWDQRELLTEIQVRSDVLRPANLPAAQPGRGFGTWELADGTRIGVLLLLGRTFMNNPAENPFQTARTILETQGAGLQHIVVDMHAEATSEKIAMGRFLDGKVSAVLGTHTHVATADEGILPGGTAFQSDVGMVGARESILGRAIEPVLHRFVTGLPARFDVVDKGIRLHATLLTLAANGRATNIQRIIRDHG